MTFKARLALSIGTLVLGIGIALAADAGDAASSTAPDTGHKWVGAKKCKSCHKKADIGNQMAAWERSKHASAFETLASEKAHKWAKERGLGEPQTAGECVKCHVSAFNVSDDLVSSKFDRAEGVQCESCHGPGKDYRKKKVMIDRDLAISKGLIVQSEKVCLVCHNDESPAWDPERYTRDDGSKTGFDYEQAVERIAHPVPEGYDPGSADAD